MSERPFILVTGAGRGIGAATARLAAARGYAVGLNYRSNAAAAEAVAADVERAGGEALLLPADVADEAAVVAMFERLDAAGQTLKALVNNAGMVSRVAAFLDYDQARLETTFKVNVVGSFLCAREAARRMATSRGGAGGAIVNLSSAAARLGSPGEFIDYAASKGAIDTFTLGLSKELAKEDIRVNAVRPGLIDTEIHASAGAPERVERLGRTVPLRRAGSAEEVAAAVLWLLSAEASYVTGALIDVAGGR